MGQCFLYSDDLSFLSVAKALETLIPAEISNLEPGKQKYSQLLNSDGGIIDDLMIGRLGFEGQEHKLYLVVNAGKKLEDFEYIKKNLPEGVNIDIADDYLSLISLQGPEASEILTGLNSSIADLLFMSSVDVPLTPNIWGHVSRSGYTGEDGFEISVKNSDVRSLVNILLQNEDVEMIGLGARDSLRLEAGLCLYGQDIDENISPIEAGLIWSIQKSRRLPNMQYKGVKRIIADIQNVNSKRLVGIRPEGKVPARAGTEIQDAEGNQIGLVTSGGYSPTLGCPIAMGYVNGKFKKVGTPINLVIRNKSMPASVVKVPFVSTKYYRG
jgi:aminomethyltransferase